MRASDGRATPLAPAAVAGIVLLVVAALLLGTGGAVSLGNAAQFDLWLVGVGVILVLGALLATLLLGDGAPAGLPRGAPSGASPARRAGPMASPAGSADADASARPASGNAGPFPRPRASFSVASSIPAQFDRPLPTPAVGAMGLAPWEEDADAGISLPFSAVPPARGPDRARYGEVGDETPYGPVAYLEQEVDRLREKVRELEQPDPGRWARVESAPSPVARSVATGPRPPEPPSLDGRNGRRSCAGCGHGLPGGATDPLCWGCGRPLCATCYWRTTAGASPHTCPSCYARANGAAVSGGRATPAEVSRSAGAAAATPPR
jgi:hypothetical protein